MQRINRTVESVVVVGSGIIPVKNGERGRSYKIAQFSHFSLSHTGMLLIGLIGMVVRTGAEVDHLYPIRYGNILIICGRTISRAVTVNGGADSF